MLVSVRMETSKSITGQLGHDIDKRPDYANKELSDQNHVFYGANTESISTLIQQQKKEVLDHHASHVTARRDAIKDIGLDSKWESKELNGIRSWRKDTVIHKTMIVTFDNDFYKNKDFIDRSELDRCMDRFSKVFSEKHSCKIAYIVRHEDETTPHYHMTVTNYNCATHRALNFQKKELSGLQDLAGECFSSMGIKRGIKKTTRINEAKKTEPHQQANETKNDYEKRIRVAANTMHRKVSQLHIDLPSELQAKKVQLENISIALEKTETNLTRAQSQKESIESEIKNLQCKSTLQSTKLLKLEKRIDTYERRIENKKIEADILEQDIIFLDQKFLELEDKIDVRQQTLSQYESDIESRYTDLNHLDNEIGKRENELDKCDVTIKARQQELKSLASKAFKSDPREKFEIVTSHSLLGKTKTKFVDLVRPSLYLEKCEQVIARQTHISHTLKENASLKQELESKLNDVRNKENNVDKLINDRFAHKIIMQQTKFYDAFIHLTKVRLGKKVDQKIFDQVATEISEKMEISSEGNIEFKI